MLPPPLTVPAFVISLPGSDRLDEALRQVSLLTSQATVIPGILQDPATLLHREMLQLEAYGRKDLFCGPYAARAVGCRKAGLAALKAGVDAGAYSFLVVQDDLEVTDIAAVRRTLDARPENWECVWFDTSQITKPSLKMGDDLLWLRGARLCTCFLIRTSYAAALIPRLEEAACEWDVFMEREMGAHLYYGPVSPCVRQRPGKSEITGEVKWVR